jgi:hypothetical protein
MKQNSIILFSERDKSSISSVEFINCRNVKVCFLLRIRIF